MSRVLALLLLTLSLASPACGIQRPGEPPYTEAEFTYSTDPTRAILHMKVTNNARERWEMTLFGDGKMVLFEEIRGQAQKQAVSLPDDEVRDVLRKVVDSGLAEWDPLAFDAQFSEKYGGKSPPRMFDAPRVTITISLDSYARGDFDLVDVRRNIKAWNGEGSRAEMFPDIPEYGGIAYLLDLRREKAKQLEKK